MYKIQCKTPGCFNENVEIEIGEITDLIVCGVCFNNITEVNGESIEASSEVPNWLT